MEEEEANSKRTWMIFSLFFKIYSEDLLMDKVKEIESNLT